MVPILFEIDIYAFVGIVLEKVFLGINSNGLVLGLQFLFLML